MQGDVGPATADRLGLDRTLGTLALAAAVFLLALACLEFTREVGRVAAVWPVNAIVVAATLRGARRVWPRYLLAGLAGNLAADLFVGDSLTTALELTACNSLEIAICVGLARRLIGQEIDLGRQRDLILFLFTAGGVAPLSAAVCAVLTLSHLRVAPVLPTLFGWYAPDALGLLIVTPALLALTPDALTSLDRKLHNRQGALSVAVMATAVVMVFGQDHYPLLFLIPPALILVAFELNVAGAALALLVTSVIALVATLTGHGPAMLIHGGLSARLGVLQLFLATLAVAVLPVAAALAKRERMAEALRASLSDAEAARTSAAEALRILALAQQVAHVGEWRRNRAGDNVISDRALAILGISREALTNRPEDVAVLYHPDDWPKVTAAVQASLATGAPFRLKVRLNRPGEGGAVVVLKGEAERDAEGEIVAVVGVVRDVTDEEQARQRAEESEARFRLLADASTDIVLKFGVEGAIDYISPSIRRYGYEPEQLVGTSALDLIHEDDLEKARSVLAEHFQLGTIDPNRDRTYRLRTANGGVVWMEGNPAIIRDETGAPQAVITQLRDISERHAANEALAESEARYRLLAANSTDVIACYGPDAIFTFLSPALGAVLGYEPEELVGKPTTAIMHPDDVRPVLRMFGPYVAAGPGAEPIRFTYRALRRDGTMIWLEAHPKAIFDPDTGALVEFQDTVRDVTARVGLEVDLRAARDAAEAAAAVKSDFMANMSHEIRTPLTAILGFTSLLAGRSDLDDGARTQVQRVSGAGQALLSIVNDILDFSKLEAGQVEIAARPVSPADVLRDTVLMFSPQAEAKGLTLAFVAEDDLPQAVLIDPDRVRQVLLNLMGNAVKFTEQGSVRVVATYSREEQRLQVRVEDSGAGMSKVQQQKLFQRFSQVDASSTRRHGGTGLGLAICKGLVEAMGGEIGVRSQPGHGSVFHFQIDAPPAEAPTATAASTDLAGGLADIRVLVVDDNPTNRELARAILESLGAEVTEAQDGAAAVELASLLPVDVILLDIRMPGLSGPETLARIRAEDGPNQDVPILAFTADIDLDDLNLDHGFDGLVRKPIAAADLAAAIHRCTLWELPEPVLESTDVAAL